MTRPLSAENATLVANGNLFNLSTNAYPGRGIVMGRTKTGALVQIYWVMGRSEGSRNRVFTEDCHGVFAEAADLSKVKGNPALLHYQATGGGRIEWVWGHVVSNGKHTVDVRDKMLEIGRESDAVGILSQALAPYFYEPDQPICTPRIAALALCNSRSKTRQRSAAMAILRKSPFGDSCERDFYSWDELPHGYGFCLTTYAGDGNPPPPFRGEPYLVPLESESAGELAEGFWSVLDAANKVSLVAETLSVDGMDFSRRIINKYERVSPA